MLSGLRYLILQPSWVHVRELGSAFFSFSVWASVLRQGRIPTSATKSILKPHVTHSATPSVKTDQFLGYNVEIIQEIFDTLDILLDNLIQVIQKIKETSHLSTEQNQAMWRKFLHVKTCWRSGERNSLLFCRDWKTFLFILSQDILFKLMVMVKWDYVYAEFLGKWNTYV